MKIRILDESVDRLVYFRFYDALFQLISLIFLVLFPERKDNFDYESAHVPLLLIF